MADEERTWTSDYGAALVLLAVLVGAAGFFWLVRPPHRHASLELVGPEACRECHEEQYADWAKTRMAQSFEVLRAGAKSAEKVMANLDPDVDYTLDEACLHCHTTGYGMVGGFVSEEATPSMAGVSCESCHGAGGRYAELSSSGDFDRRLAEQAGLIYPPTEQVCRACHNDESPFVGMDYVFDFDQRVLDGTHDHHRLEYTE